MPLSPPAFLTSPLFSLKARVRVLSELLSRPRIRTTDISMEEFVRSHFGPEIVNYGLNPIVSGIYAGDPKKLSARYSFPKIWELEQLHGEPEWNSGQNAKTLVKYEDFRVVLTALKARARLPGHQTRARISIQTVAGHILVRAEGRTFDLPTGTLLALDRDLPHDVEALEESAFLITIAWPGGNGTRAR